MDKFNLEAKYLINPEGQTEDNPIFEWTGHPFTDAGLSALLLLSGKSRPEELAEKDVEIAVEFASKLYLMEGWSTLLARIYRNNNPILMVNPSMRKSATQEKLKESLRILFNLAQQNLQEPRSPTCQICGKRRIVSGLELRAAIHSKEKDRPKEITGDVFPLLGTGDLRNYFPHGQESGADVCACCLFLAQFIPIGSYVLHSERGKIKGILVIHAHPHELQLDLVSEIISKAKTSFLVNNARGFRQPVNFLFKKLQELSLTLEQLGNATVTAYYFLNGNRTGEQWVEVIRIPNPVLRFLTHAKREDYNGWKNIVRMGWREKPNNEKLEEYEKNRANDVYSRLLEGRSILAYFVDISERVVNAKWNLLKFYCSEVLGLEKEALDFIRRVGDRIVETLEKLEDNKLRQRVRELERAEKLYQFEAFFVNTEKLRQSLGIPEPLMTFDEFARILTSYGEDINVSWKTVKHLLLFRIYENLHDKLMKGGEEAEERGEIEFFGIEEVI